MLEEHDLAEKLRKLEALFARPGSEGERTAAANALERLRARLSELERTQPPQEYRFGMPDAWSRALFVALARRYGLEPYRRRGQRSTSVMLRVSPSFLDETLWPEFVELQKVLHGYLADVTQRLIARVIHPDVTDAVERPELESGRGDDRRERASAP